MLLNVTVVAGASAAVLRLADPSSAWSDAISSWTGVVASQVWGLFGASPPEWLSGEISPLVAPAGFVADLFSPWRESPASLLLLVLAAVLLLVGSVLPDIDAERSLLGRFFPSGWLGPHRGITHTDWVAVALLLPGLLVPWLWPLLWLWLGYALHLVVDGWSAAGRARFWPFGRWRTINYDDGSECVVVDGRHRGLYRSGSAQEIGVLAVACAAGIALLAAAVLV